MTGGRSVPILGLVCGLAFGAGCGGGPAAKTAAASPPDRAGAHLHPSVFYDVHSFAQAQRGAGPARPAEAARGVIVPHHWLAGHLIVRGLRDAAAGRPLDRVVLIAPNHIGAGGAPVTTSDRPWSTPHGTVEPDGEVVRRLAAAGLAVVAPDVLTHEHALAGLMPALAAEIPGARVVPLAVHGLSRARAGALARRLAPLLDDRTVIVAAVDFSHYLAPERAKARDAETLAALRTLDSAAIAGFGNDNLDSPGSIMTLMETMRLAGATTLEVRDHANSAQFTGRSPGGTTSYIYGLYR